MRILAISHLFPTVASPAYGIWVPRQLSAMVQGGAQVDVLIPAVLAPRILRVFPRWRKYNHLTGTCEFNELRTHVIPYARPTGNWYYRWAGHVLYRAALSIALAWHRVTPYDIIYATCIFPDGDAAVHLGKRLGIPVCCLAIGSDVNVYPDISKTMFRHFVRIVNNLDGMLACGEGLAHRVESVSNRPTPVVHGVVEADVFKPAADRESLRESLGFKREQLVLLFVGGLKKTKGVYELIESLRGLLYLHPKTVLKIIGTGIELDGLRKEAESNGLEECVEFVGAVGPNEVARWMQASDVLVLPSYSEGMPNVVMEAMACGTPVVATTVGGLPRAVGECEGVELVKPQSVEELTDALHRVLANEEIRVRMGAAALAWSPRFSAKQSAQRILTYLDDLVSQHRASKKN